MTASVDGDEVQLPRRMGLRLALRIVGGTLFIVAVLFLPAGSWGFWPAWIWLGVFLAPMLLATGYFLRSDPALIERRLQVREERNAQRKIVLLTNLVFIGGFLLPGFDYRFGWSAVPVALVIAANAVVLLGYVFVLWVMKVNSYASRTIEVVEGQRVIDTGPYAVVRHPMYSGLTAMMLASPIALGSFWAVLPFLLVPALLALRIRDEEHALADELEGYAEYRERVRWRLVPGIW